MVECFACLAQKRRWLQLPMQHTLAVVVHTQHAGGGRQRGPFKAITGYIASSRPAWHTRDPVSETERCARMHTHTHTHTHTQRETKQQKKTQKVLNFKYISVFRLARSFKDQEYNSVAECLPHMSKGLGSNPSISPSPPSQISFSLIYYPATIPGRETVAAQQSLPSIGNRESTPPLL